MLGAFVVAFVSMVLFGMALAVGQLFGRKPITPKCNPGICCLEGRDCRRRHTAASPRD